MRYLYGEVNRTLLDGIDQKTARNLLGAAHYFQLDGLQRICEIVLSKALTTENCVSIYKTAKVGHHTFILWAFMNRWRAGMDYGLIRR